MPTVIMNVRNRSTALHANIQRDLREPRQPLTQIVLGVAPRFVFGKAGDHLSLEHLIQQFTIGSAAQSAKLALRLLRRFNIFQRNRLMFAEIISENVQRSFGGTAAAIAPRNPDGL